jgi:uncharacterized membrane protein
MIRPRHEPHFEWRGKDVSRLEGLSDAVFAFAITLLVVSLEVPRDAETLVRLMKGFVGFIFSFFLLYRLWTVQYRFFRRYGLEDSTTLTLNGILLFFVMFFIYPLKFLTTAITNWVLDHGADSFHPGTLTAAMRSPDAQFLLVSYFFGTSAVFATLALMYRHAYRRREHIGLSEDEAWRTKHASVRLAMSAFVAAAAPWSFVAMTSGRVWLGIVLQYGTIGILFAYVLHNRLARRRRAALALSATGATAAGD